MTRRSRVVSCALACALAMVVTLSGCKIPFVNVEVPIPEIGMPDISSLPIPKFKLPIGVNTSVEEARKAARTGRPYQLSDTALVVPGYLTVGVKTATSTAPTCFIGTDGNLYGLDVDLGAALASEMGLLVRYVPVVDGSALGTECDVIMNGVTDNPDSIAIAGLYVESATAFFHKGEASVATATELGGKSVGLQSGSQSETVLNESGLKMSQHGYANLNEAFEGLAAGEVDYVLCEAYPGAYLSTQHNGMAFAGTLETPKPAGVAVSATNTELVDGVRSAFDTIAANGIFEGLRSRWVGTMPTLTSSSEIQGIS